MTVSAREQGSSPSLVHAPVNAAAFRAALRRLAGGITVITVGQGDDLSGLTVTSVSSLSAEPPSVVFCINRSSSSWLLLNRYRTFGVNGLAIDHREIAARFSGKGGTKGGDRYAGANWTTEITGVPLLADALFALDCTVDDIIDRAESSIVIGTVVAARVRDEQTSDSPLAYWQGQFSTLQI